MIKKIFREIICNYKRTTRVTKDLEAYHAMEQLYYQTGML